MAKPLVIALLGAESTGKSTLSLALAAALRGEGHAVSVVTEHLREWCDAQRRVPKQSEQADIAKTQSARIEAGIRLGEADFVIADTTALMTAVYSDYLFADTDLYGEALAAQKTYDLNLLTGLDVPWQMDGLQRDGAHVRPCVDTRIRQALASAGITAHTLYGAQDARLQAALAAVRSRKLLRPSWTTSWKHYCDFCGDGGCEKNYPSY
jgi:nicotinamide riboside kinase